MKKLKTTIILSAFCIFINSGISFAENFSFDSVLTENESLLYNEVNSSYKNQFYPGTVAVANQFIETYPDSVYIPQVLLYKAEALVYMQNYDEAETALLKTLEHARTGNDVFSKCTFLLGKTKYFQKEYEKALNYFSRLSKTLTEENSEYEEKAIYYSAKSLFYLNDYSNAAKYFEIIISNGKNYSASEYNSSLNCLFTCYDNLGEYKKITTLFETLPKASFEEDFYYQLCLFVAQAYESMNMYKDAYVRYLLVFENSTGSLAVVALKKAYLLSENHDVGYSTDEVFVRAVAELHYEEELVEEFYLRLGIEQFENKNFSKAEKYLGNIKNDFEQNRNAKIAGIYKAKILMEKKNYQEAYNLLVEIERSLDEDSQDLSDSVNSELLYCSFNLRNEKKYFSKIPDYYKKINEPDYNCKYILSSYYYEQKDYSKVLTEVENLYASALCKTGDYKKACEVYAKYEMKNLMQPADFTEYSKALFYCGDYKTAYEKILKSDDADKEYIAGLCSINLQNWTQSKNHFAAYIKNQSGKSDFKTQSFYYKGVAEFSLGENRDSYSSFSRYISESPSAKNIFKAYEYAAKNALLNKDSKNAYFNARKMLEVYKTQEEKEYAVIFLSEIYADFNDFENAEIFLSEYKNGKSDFNARIKMILAGLYQRQGKLKAADSEYQNVLKENPKSSYAQEAMFRNGELYYLAGDFESALNRFSNYIYSYANGDYYQQTLFYAGECAYKVGEYERSIMFCKTLLQNSPDGIYSFSANLNLLNSYYAKTDYSLALDLAKKMVSDFPKESEAAGITKKASELELIVKGTSPKIVEKKSEYEKNGGTKTYEGRVAGSELVQLYSQNPITVKDAFELAQEILPKQTSKNESKYAAQNSEVIADYYRSNEQNSLAAKYYLDAAKLYRTCGDENGAASVLYSATESFIHEGLAGDAKETAELLKELYPQSRYAERVDNFFIIR